jgi:hypothetical protein
MQDIEIVMPEGMLGPEEDYLLDSAIRAIAEKYAEEGEWANKYGVNYENGIFMMHRYCWCEQSDCPWCLGCQCSEYVWTERIPEKMCDSCRNQKDPAPNFHYKPLDLKVWWYKYIGRDMKSNKHLDHLQISEMLLNCLK